MTNEEEKILEEEKDITLEDAAAEEAEELQKEVREEIRLDPEDVLERPVLRGGLRGAADPNMIQKHIDNFLAMLCGETPVDSNVRTSAEYWLKRLATGEGAGSTKKIYCHPISLVNSAVSAEYKMALTMLIFNNDETPFTTTTLKKFIDDLYTTVGDTIRIMINGCVASASTGTVITSYLYKSSASTYGIVGINTSSTFVSYNIVWDDFVQGAYIYDGVNPIN